MDAKIKEQWLSGKYVFVSDQFIKDNEALNDAVKKIVDAGIKEAYGH